jgi:hypothetical protein
MLFQTLDDKDKCVGVYADGELYFSNPPAELSATWNYAPYLKNRDVLIAQIYAEGRTLEESCPPELKNEFDRVSKKMKAFISSFVEAKVSLDENCFYELVPQRFLKEYCEVKNKITQHVIDTHQKPLQYNFFKELTELTYDISQRPLNINRGWLAQKLYNVQAKRLWEKVNDGHTHVKYNVFGSITGRFSVSEKSFPILNLNKNLRECLEPTNDWFVEMDLNGAELRMAQALLGKAQVEGDFHEWSAVNIFNSELNRTQAKETATQWLYNSHTKLAVKYDSELDRFYNKDALVSMYYMDGAVVTPFGRTIPCDLHHSISYLNQSSLINLFHRQILKANKLLENSKSFIAFTVHDCVVLDLAESDKNKLPDIIKTLSDTKYGMFPVSVKIGKDYGNMKKVKIKA